MHTATKKTKNTQIKAQTKDPQDSSKRLSNSAILCHFTTHFAQSIDYNTIKNWLEFFMISTDVYFNDSQNAEHRVNSQTRVCSCIISTF